MPGGDERRLGRLLVACLWVIPILFSVYLTAVDRWPEGERQLAQMGAQFHLVVGVSVERSPADTSQVARRTQVYLAWPMSVRTLGAYAVTQDGRGVRTDTAPYALLVYGLLYGAWIGASVWYLIRHWPAPRA